MVLINNDIPKLNKILNKENIILSLTNDYSEVEIYYNNIHVMTLDSTVYTHSFMQILLVLLKIKPAYWRNTSELDSPNLIKYINNDICKFNIDYIYKTYMKSNGSLSKFVLLFNNDFITSRKDFYEAFSNRNHKEIGLALGFPPIAVNDFITNPDANRVALDYYGFKFTVKEANYKEALNYMKNTYVISDTIKEVYNELFPEKYALLKKYDI